MKRTINVLLIAIISLTFIIPASTSIVLASSGYPYFFISSVEGDKSVTIQAYNFPANDTFTVTMGSYGTQGIGGIVVASTSTGSGGSFTATYAIPTALNGMDKIAIRMQSPTSGYYAYNWFYNNTATGGTTGPGSGYTGYPYFFVTSVVQDQTVTIQTYNFPLNDTFTVTMGPYGTLGIGGVVIASTSTDGVGSFTVSYPIPAALAGSYRIAIRLQSPTSGYYAYNWFYNNTANVSVTPAPTPIPNPTSTPGAIYTGSPYFFIQSVVKDKTVTVNAYNFPANDKFTVTMGPYGTQGIGGIVVTTTDTGNGGAFTATYNIPNTLAGSHRIAIRLQSSVSGYFAYNWFYNNTTP